MRIEHPRVTRVWVRIESGDRNKEGSWGKQLLSTCKGKLTKRKATKLNKITKNISELKEGSLGSQVCSLKMGFRCHRGQCGCTQLHGRHAHWIGLGQGSSTLLGLNLVRLDLRLWLANRKNSLSEHQEERPEDKKLTDWLQKVAGGPVHRTSCRTATGNQAMAEKERQHHEARKKRPFCCTLSPLSLTDKSQLHVRWQERKWIGSYTVFWEQGTEGGLGAESTKWTAPRGYHGTTTGSLYKAIQIGPTSSEHGTKVYSPNLS